MKEQIMDQPLWQIIWRDHSDEPHVEMFDCFSQSHARSKELYETGFAPNWHQLDPKEPDAIRWHAEQAKANFTPEADFEVIDRNFGRVRYTGTSKNVVVPPMVDGCIVRTLSYNAFDTVAFDLSYVSDLRKMQCSSNQLATLDLTSKVLYVGVGARV